VELEANHCEGLVLKDALPEDDLVYDEENLQHISQMSGKRYRLGDHVTVQVVDTNLARKSVYFEVVEKG
jgi:ribonuclease R